MHRLALHECSIGILIMFVYVVAPIVGQVKVHFAQFVRAVSLSAVIKTMCRYSWMLVGVFRH